MSVMMGAVVLTLAGLGCIFGVWRRSLARYWLALGWLLLAAAGAGWIAATGPEFGITLAFTVPALAAWALVIGNARWRSPRRTGGETSALRNGQAVAWPRHLLAFLLSVPLAALASAHAAVGMAVLLPWREVNAILAVVVVVPILWGAAAYWACADPRPLRPAAAMTVAGLLGAGLIYS